MSEDKRKNARTQGRFSGGDKEYSSRQQNKKSPKSSSADKNKGEIRKSPITGSRAKNEIDVQYDEEDKYSFKQLDPVKRPQEIKFTKLEKVLSETENGISRLIYDPDFINMDQADEYLKILRNTTEWNDKKIIIRGEEHDQPRLVAWYGPYPYTYAGATLEAKEMPDIILQIKKRAEAKLREFNINVELNSVLLNWYRDERDSVAWHSDDELSLGVCPTIASVSLGETRRFEIRSKGNTEGFDASDIIYVNLTHGSLIIMDGCMQKDWQHRVPKEYHGRLDRINLTFRTIYHVDPLSPKMSHVLVMKTAKSPTERMLHQPEPKFDAESFPPLGMEASAKKTRWLPKENNKDYQQSRIQRTSQEAHWGASDKKTEFLPKRNNNKSYQQSVIQIKPEEQECWDDEMLQVVEDTEETIIQNNQNKKSSYGPIINLKAEEFAKSSNMQCPSTRFIQSECYSDSSETFRSHDYERTDCLLLESEDTSLSESKLVELYSDLGESAELNNNHVSSFIKGEYKSNSSKTHQSYNYEEIGNHFLESKDSNMSENKTVEIKPDLIEINTKTGDGGKMSVLNADAPDFIPQNKFDRFSVTQFADYCHCVKDEELLSFTDSLLNCLQKNESFFFSRDWYELDVYYKLTEDGLISNKHLRIILERIGSLIWNTNKRNEGYRHESRYRQSNKSYDDNNYRKYKQSFGRSQK